MGVFTFRASLYADVDEVPDLTGVIGLLVFLQQLPQKLVHRREGLHNTANRLTHNKAFQLFTTGLNTHTQTERNDKAFQLLTTGLTNTQKTLNYTARYFSYLRLT